MVEKVMRGLACLTACLVAMLAAAAGPVGAGYWYANPTHTMCTSSVGYGVNYAGQDQAAVYSTDTGCSSVKASLHLNGSYRSSRSDSTYVYSAVTTHSNANGALFTLQADDGTWGGFFYGSW